MFICIKRLCNLKLEAKLIKINVIIIFKTQSVQLFDYAKNKKIKTWKGHEKDITKVS